MKKLNIKHMLSLPYLVVFVLFTAVIATSYMTRPYNAKFITGSSSFDEARIAAFDVSTVAAQPSGALMFDNANFTTTYTFSVTNNSEVAVGANFTVKFANGVPKVAEGLEMHLSNDDRVLSAYSIVSDKTEYTFTDTFMGTETRNYSLKFILANVDSADDFDVSGIQVNMVAVQLD